MAGAVRVTRLRALARWLTIAAGNLFGLVLLVYAAWLIYVPLGYALAGLALLGVAWVVDKEGQ